MGTPALQWGLVADEVTLTQPRALTQVPVDLLCDVFTHKDIITSNPNLLEHKYVQFGPTKSKS